MKQVFSVLLISVSIGLSYGQNQDKGADKAYSAEDLISSYYNDDFRPFSKGSWQTRLSFSLSDKDLQNATRLFDVVEAGSDLSYNISLAAGRYMSDYFMVGAGLGYSESKFSGSLVNLDSDTIYSNSISRNYSVSPHVRITMPLTSNQRLSFYTDMGLSFGYGQALKRDTENIDEIETLSGDQFVFGAGISPGIIFFAMENFAFEAGLNLIGYRLNIENSTDGYGVESRIVEHDVNFRLNVLSVNIGIAYYF